MRARTLPALLGLLTLAVAAGPAQAASEAEVRRINSLISDWQVAEARAALAPLLAADAADPGVQVAYARLQYLEGNYGGAVDTLDAVGAALPGGMPEELARFREEVAGTRDALKGFDEHVTEDRRFLIRYQGKDAVILPWLIEVLRKTDDALAADFAYRPEGQVIVEIYPEIRYLAAVSPLTEEEIETSGTIALCKYNRLMFTSPRALVRGYGWRDTVAHEFVHYYVTKKTRDAVPIWLHEGIAKFQESRWRHEPGETLAPPQEDLLARSLKADRLVTFQQMHPSMAKLPSQEAASLAFAEVHTVIDFLHRRRGYEALNGLLDRLKAGADMDDALNQTYGFDLEGLWRVWKRDLGKRGFKTYPGLVQTSLKFKRPGVEEDTADSSDIDTISEKRVKDFAHLGELLRARGRDLAALSEYRKAIALGGDGNPMVQNAAAHSMLALSRPQEVPETLDRVRRFYPDFLTTWLNLGDAYLELGRESEARAAYNQAVGINPFHPKVHAALVELHAAAGDEPAAQRSRDALKILGYTPGDAPEPEQDQE